MRQRRENFHTHLSPVKRNSMQNVTNLKKSQSRKTISLVTKYNNFGSDNLQQPQLKSKQKNEVMKEIWKIDDLGM